jgi:uncharacterized protein (TIGR02246 family)
VSENLTQLLGELEMLRAEVQRLNDIQEITRLKGRYCHCTETRDWAGLAELVTDDYQQVSDSGAYTGRDEFIEFVSATLSDTVNVFHAHTEEIDITGPDAATGLWTRSSYVIMPGAGSPIVVHSYGHYRESYVRTPDGWRIQRTDETTQQLDLESASPAQVEALAKVTRQR